jgi:hypothetical protein
VAQLRNEDVPRIDDALTPIRAAISMIGDGWATRIVIHAAGGEQLLPAARLLARASGVNLVPVWTADVPGCDLVLTPGVIARA